MAPPRPVEPTVTEDKPPRRSRARWLVPLALVLLFFCFLAGMVVFFIATLASTQRVASGTFLELTLRGAVSESPDPLGQVLPGIAAPPSVFEIVEALDQGYAGVQLGTRFIATTECKAHDDYKRAIVNADGDDIVLTDKISGVPVAVIKTPYIERVGTKANPVMRRALRHPKLKHYARMYYTMKSIWQLKRASLQGMSYKDYFQAGKSVDGITSVEPAGDIVRRYAEAARREVAAK